MPKTIKTRPTKLVFCPHCSEKVEVQGIGQFSCKRCRREFFYNGPFEIHCRRCGYLISLSPEKGSVIAACPRCGQRYNLKNPKKYSKSTKRKCCEGCADCASGFEGCV